MSLIELKLALDWAENNHKKCAPQDHTSSYKLYMTVKNTYDKMVKDWITKNVLIYET